MSCVSFRQGMSAGVVGSNCLVGAGEMRLPHFTFKICKWACLATARHLLSHLRVLMIAYLPVAFSYSDLGSSFASFIIKRGNIINRVLSGCLDAKRLDQDQA